VATSSLVKTESLLFVAPSDSEPASPGAVSEHQELAAETADDVRLQQKGTFLTFFTVGLSTSL